MNKNLKRILVIGALLIISIILSIVELYIPMPIPEINLWLSGIIILIMLYQFKPYEAFLLEMVRVLVVAFIRGTIRTPSFTLAVFGSLAAFLVMFLFRMIKGFSIVLVSTLGMVFHMSGQIISLMIIADIKNGAVAVPILISIAACFGILYGILAKFYLKTGFMENLLSD